MTTERNKWIRFGVASTMIAFIWSVVLPAIASQKGVSEHIANQKQLGIDPSALFYTELEVTPGIVSHMERMNESHFHLFWGRETKSSRSSAKSDITR